MQKLANLFTGSRFWVCVLAVVLVASLVPLLAIAQYSHPSADDYPYALATHAAWQETGSIWAVLRAAAHTVAQRYQTWQGSFSAIFLFALQPAIFGEGLYGLGTVFLLGAAMAAVAAAVAALHRVTGAPLSTCAVLGLLYALVCIQFLPSPAQGYYWWNGASYYWLFFFGLLALCALLARLMGPGLSGAGTAGAALLAAVLGEPVPQSIEEKRAMCLKHHVALWDTIARCNIAGASDLSIRNAEPNDIGKLVRESEITRIFATGGKSAELYRKLIEPQLHIPITQLPSTSPANAAWSLDRLIEAYRVIL